MKLNRRGALGIAAAALAVIGGGAAFATAGASPVTTVTAVTHIANDHDSGNGGDWNNEQIDRTLTVTAAATAGAYTATVNDTGTFVTLPGAKTPNQVILNQRIANVVSGKMTCSATYAITAPSNSTLSSAPNGGLVTSINDNFQHLGSGPQSFSDWPAQAFSGASSVTQLHYTCTYTTPLESWTDSDSNSDGDMVSAGNITGLLAPPPVIIRLSHGHGTSTAPTRETVSFQQSGGPSWDMFTIIGPGAINGHQGWVQGQVGLNVGVYSGLEANHGYTSCYTPVTSRGSTTQVPGSHGGCVYFISNH